MSILKLNNMQQITRCSRHGYRAFSSSASVVENVLTQSNKERTIGLLKKVKSLRGWIKNAERQAAVCIPMCTVDDQLSLLFTLRSTLLPSHGGQVSFPGGMWQQSDSDIIETGLREMHEEISIPPSSVDVWGTQTPIPSYNEIAVTPILCYIGNVELDKIKADPSEVSDVFSIPLSVLSNPSFHRYTRYCVPATPTHASYSYTLPVFLGGRYKVWGLTAMATDQCLKALLPEHYTHVVMQIMDKQTTRLDAPLKRS